MFFKLVNGKSQVIMIDNQTTTQYSQLPRLRLHSFSRFKKKERKDV